MRSCNVLVSLLVAGCVVPASQSPLPESPQVSQSPAQESAQVEAYWQPQPIIKPQSEPYQPPPPQTLQTVYYDEPGYDTVNVNATGEAVGSIDVFYDQLDPYGTWHDDATYGWVFSPSQSSYVPYSNGHWKYTDYGMLWVSSDPFGWATDHYGRWVYQSRWVWRPDLTWGPAWVSWRQCDGWIGWAPAGYTTHAYVPEDHWRFVAAPELLSIEISRRYVASNIRRYLDLSVPIVRYHRHDKDVWVAGPSEDWMRRYRLDVKRERAETIELGRLDAQRRSDAERHARQRQHEWDQRRAREVHVRRDLDERVRNQRDAQNRLVEEQRRLGSERRKQQDERNRLEDQQRRNHEAQARAGNDAERRRTAEEQRKLAEHQKQLEDVQRRTQQALLGRQQQEQRRREDDGKRQRAEQDRANAEQQRRSDDQKRKATDDEHRRAVEIEKRKAADDQHRAADDRRKQQDEQRKLQADAKRKPDDRKRAPDDRKNVEERDKKTADKAKGGQQQP
jgi:hypothetical protein